MNKTPLMNFVQITVDDVALRQYVEQAVMDSIKEAIKLKASRAATQAVEAILSKDIPNMVHQLVAVHMEAKRGEVSKSIENWLSLNLDDAIGRIAVQSIKKATSEVQRRILGRP